MKNPFKPIAGFLLVFALTCVAAFAVLDTKQVTFGQAVTVNGTLVKAGTYKITFNDQTGELAVLDGKKTVATASARLEKQQGGAQSGYSTKNVGESHVLSSIAMNKGNRVMIINDGESKNEPVSN